MMHVGYDSYKTHTALNLHFSKGNYDYFKYNGNVKVSVNKFNANGFRWSYAAISKKYPKTFYWFYLAYKQLGFKYAKPKMLMQCLRNKLIDVQYTMLSEHTFLDTVFKTELETIREVYISNNNSNEMYPLVYNLYIDNIISLETLLLINEVADDIFFESNSKDIVSWPLICNNMNRITGFIRTIFDLYEARQIFVDVMGKH